MSAFSFYLYAIGIPVLYFSAATMILVNNKSASSVCMVIGATLIVVSVVSRMLFPDLFAPSGVLNSAGVFEARQDYVALNTMVSRTGTVIFALSLVWNSVSRVCSPNVSAK